MIQFLANGLLRENPPMMLNLWRFRILAATIVGYLLSCSANLAPRAFAATPFVRGGVVSDVSLEGDLLAIGINKGSLTEVESGIVLVFRLRGGCWQHDATLAPPDPATGAFFGAVAIVADAVLIGSPGDDENGKNAGAVYVFEHMQGEWSLRQKIVPTEALPGDCFGQDLATSDDMLVVASPGSRSEESALGAAYVFRRHGSRWAQQSRLTCKVGGPTVESVGTSNGLIVVGGYVQESEGHRQCVAKVFMPTASGWAEDATLKIQSTENVDIRSVRPQVSTCANTIMLGHFLELGQGPPEHAAYVFECADGIWQVAGRVALSGGKYGGAYSPSCAVAPDYAVLGVGTGFLDGGAGSANAGGVVVMFSRRGPKKDWKGLSRVEISEEWFGATTAIRGKTVIVGGLARLEVNGDVRTGTWAYECGDQGVTNGQRLQYALSR